jgi:hypothetical protein
MIDEPSAEFVRELQQIELGRRPENPLLGPARQMLGNQAQDKRRLDDVIPVARRIETVRHDSLETQTFRGNLAGESGDSFPPSPPFPRGD